jgi:transcriptional regulator with XRE-family HTH domain
MTSLIVSLLETAKLQGLSQKQLAASAGLPEETLSRLKRKRSVQTDVLERLARCVGLQLALQPAGSPAAPARPQRFQEKYRHLVWSNPEAPASTFIRQALLRPEFSVLLDAAVEFGLPAVQEQWRILQAEGSPEARRAATTTTRMLRNIQDGHDQAAA